MMEIAAAISLATSTFNALKKGMEAGREIEDMMDYYGKWFEAKEALSENAINNSKQPLVKNCSQVTVSRLRLYKLHRPNIK